MSFSSDRPLLSNQLPLSIEFPNPDEKKFIEVLTLIYKRIANSVNSKEGALYNLQELASYNQFFSYSVPATFTVDPNRFRNGYRTTFDLVSLNGGPIPAGVTALVLTSTSEPPLINGITIPTNGYGAATIAGPQYIFINDPDVYVRFDNTNPAAQEVVITNNSGSDLTQCYWVMEYLKTD